MLLGKLGGTLHSESIQAFIMGDVKELEFWVVVQFEYYFVAGGIVPHSGHRSGVARHRAVGRRCSPVRIDAVHSQWA